MRNRKFRRVMTNSSGFSITAFLASLFRTEKKTALIKVRNFSKALCVGVDGLQIEYNATNTDGNSALFAANDENRLMITIALERAPNVKDALGYRAQYKNRLFLSTTPPVGDVFEGGTKERPTIEFFSKLEKAAQLDNFEQHHLHLYLWDSGVGASVNIRQVGPAPLDEAARRLAETIAFVEDRS